ncbi:MAG: 3-5 exonuclease, partial [Mycobacterium sp.]|nr:3-5 exonuclease [Mycobacterium sp.]
MTDGDDAGPGEATGEDDGIEAAEPTEAEATPLLAPADGVPDLAVTSDQILAAAELLVS